MNYYILLSICKVLPLLFCRWQLFWGNDTFILRQWLDCGCVMCVEWTVEECVVLCPWQESWYEFRVMAVMDDLISESSNVVGVSSTGKC